MRVICGEGMRWCCARYFKYGLLLTSQSHLEMFPNMLPLSCNMLESHHLSPLKVEVVYLLWWCFRQGGGGPCLCEGTTFRTVIVSAIDSGEARHGFIEVVCKYFVCSMSLLTN